MSTEWQYIFAAISAAGNILLFFGLVFAFMQVRAANKALKAQVLMKLLDEWRDPKLYRAVIYVIRLLDQWKNLPTNEWPNLAKQWVEAHVGKNASSTDAAERALWDEWEMRRTLSQFLAKMGSLIESGYLTEGEFFNVNPEAGRQLVVLTYIERAIPEHWAHAELDPIAVWDHAFPKYEFSPLWRRYERWYKKHGSEKMILALPALPVQPPRTPAPPATPLSPAPRQPAK